MQLLKVSKIANVPAILWKKKKKGHLYIFLFLQFVVPYMGKRSKEEYYPSLDLQQVPLSCKYSLEEHKNYSNRFETLQSSTSFYKNTCWNLIPLNN